MDFLYTPEPNIPFLFEEDHFATDPELAPYINVDEFSVPPELSSLTEETSLKASLSETPKKAMAEEAKHCSQGTTGSQTVSLEVSQESADSQDSDYSSKSGNKGRPARELNPDTAEVLNKIRQNVTSAFFKTEPDLNLTTHDAIHRRIRKEGGFANQKEFTAKVKALLKAMKGKVAPRSDILTTRLGRLHSKISLVISKEKSFVKTQDYKSTNLDKYIQAFDQAYRLFMKALQETGIAWVDNDLGYFSFIYLHFPIEKVVAVAQHRNLLSQEDLDFYTTECHGKKANQVLREITAIKGGYKVQYERLPAFKATLELTLSLMAPEAHRFPKTFEAFEVYQRKLSAN